jgi:cystathionine gamma-synthase
MSLDPTTRIIRAGLNTDRQNKGVMPPIAISSNFRREDPAEQGTFDYQRTDHPGRRHLAEAIADLEGAAGALITCSGMAAIDLLLHDLPFGARVVCAHDAYGGSFRLLEARARGGRLKVDFVDLTDLEAADEALSCPAALVMAESPSNPRLRLTDISAIARLAHKAGAKLSVDNTALSPALQRPIELGADYSVQSVTKIINGHSDMIGGAVAIADPEEVERFAWWLNCAGVGAGPFDSFLALRGLRTLPLRARAQSDAALEIASWLTRHPAVKHVDHPGLTDHPGHEIAVRQQSGFGPLISFTVDGDPRALAASLDLFTLAQSMGGVESLVCIPALMTHAAMSPQARATAGISDGLVRLAVGLEAVDDLIRDLDRGLALCRVDQDQRLDDRADASVADIREAELLHQGEPRRAVAAQA